MNTFFKSIWSKSKSIHQHGQTAQYFSLSGRINYREKRPGTRREIYERRAVVSTETEYRSGGPGCWMGSSWPGYTCCIDIAPHSP